MTFGSLAWLWLALAVCCVLAGMALTGRRVAATPPPRRVTRRMVRVRGDDRGWGSTICARCAQPLEVGARFCGTCGLHVVYERDK